MMKYGLKAVTAVMTALLMTASLSGCNSSSGGSQAAKKTGQSITITAQTNGLGQDWLNNAATAFTKKTGIDVTVNFDAYLSSNLSTTLENTSSEVSDLYFVQTYEWAKWSYSGYTEDLTGFMNEADKNEGGKSLNDRMTSVKRYILDDKGDKVQSIVPLTQAPTGLVYNKEMMKYLCHDVLKWENGHDYPINTKELQEVIDALKQAQKNHANDTLFTYKQSGQKLDVKPFAWSGTVGTLQYLLYSWFGQYVGEDGFAAFLAQQNNPDLFKSDGFFKTYQEMMDLLDIQEDSNGNYYSVNSIPNCVSYNHTSSQQQFLLGKSLLIPCGSWFYSEMKASISELDNIGFMPVPWMSDGSGNPVVAKGVTMPKNAEGIYMPYSYINDPDYFVVPTASKKKELAEQFLRFLFSDAYMPTLQTDLQAPLCFSFNDSGVKKTSWFEQVSTLLNSSAHVDFFSTNKLYLYGRLCFYKNPDSAPFSRLSQSGFGSSDKLIDSATGSVIGSASQATGVAVTENVYKYVMGNYQAALSGWNEAKRLAGVN